MTVLTINYSTGSGSGKMELNLENLLPCSIHDFKILIAPINRVLGFETRTAEYVHWWTFLSAYMEIGECLFSNVISIRKKRISGKKLEPWEQEFYRENKKMVDLPQSLTDEEKEWLDSDW